MSKPDYYVENVPYVTADKLDAANDRIAAALAVLDAYRTPYVHDSLMDDLRAALTPPPARHTFGGVVYEEAESDGIIRTGRYYLTAHGDLGFVSVGRLSEGTLLRPVALESGA